MSGRHDPIIRPFRVPEGTTQSQFEAMVRRQAEEVLAVFSADGTTILYGPVVGSRNKVGIPPDCEVVGGIAVHNHPDSKAFSPSDIRSAAKHGLVATRVPLAQGGTMHAEPTKEWPTADEIEGALQDALENALDELESEASSRMTAGRPCDLAESEARLEDLLREHQQIQLGKVGVIMRVEP